MQIFWKTLTAMGLALAMLPAQAEFVSIKGKTVNVRAAPSTKADIAWELIDGYPLQVTEKRNGWLKVRDFENQLGWVHQPLTSKAAHHVVKADRANLRSGPGANYQRVARLYQYDLLETLEKRDGWIKGKTADGQVGWVSSKLLWGW